jgi:hypothetical protein
MLAMTEEPDNLTLQHLRQIRTEMQEGFAKLTTEQALTSHKIGTLAEGMVSMRQSIEGLRNDMRMVSLAVNEHTIRFDRIEVRLNLPDA